MTRIVDALRRARTNSSAGSGTDDSRVEDTIRFFAPGQPAVVSPWDIADEPAEEVRASAPSRSVESAAGPSTFVAQSSQGVRQRGGFPAGEHAEKLVISPSVSPLIRAQYGKLAAALHHAQRERGVKVLMLISAGSGEGKTLTAANIALTFSEAFEKRVLLVDTDLRKPMVHELLDVSNAWGLGDLLDRERPVPIVQVSPRLSLLPAGEYHEDPTKILTSDRMWTFVEEARVGFDWVVLDTPPLDLVPDARLLAPMTDGALLVAMAGKTLYDEIQRVADTFDPSRLLGVVLNRVTERVALGAQSSGYYAPPGR